VDPVGPVRRFVTGGNRDLVDVSEAQPRDAVRFEQLLDSSERSVQQFPKDVVAVASRRFDGQLSGRNVTTWVRSRTVIGDKFS